MSYRVLFLDSVHPVLKEKLEAMGMVCENDFNCSLEELHSKIKNYHGIVLRSRLKVDSGTIDIAENLKFIARSGSGMENIDHDYAENKGIACINSPEGNRSAVAEHAIGMLLSLFNNLNRADREVRQGQWKREENRGIELEGKTVGIIGFGNTGSTLARKLSGFGVEVIACDKKKNLESTPIAKMVSLEELKMKSDIISFHLPLTSHTHHYLNDEFLQGLEKEVYIINTSRGEIVNLSTLVKGLKSGRILGACLDVLSIEKSSFEGIKIKSDDDDLNYLFGSEKVVLSPHVAGWTIESYYKLADVLAQKIEKLLPFD